MSGGGNGAGDLLSGATDWIQRDVKNALDPVAKIKDSGKKAGEVGALFSGSHAPDGAAGAVSQVSQLEQNIYGGVNSGAIDPQTRTDLFNQLRGGENAQNVSYEDQAARIGSIQSRLDTIAAGKDLTVNDRTRLNANVLTLQDRPGRRGLLTGG